MKNILLVLGVCLSFTAALAEPGPSYRALSILDGKTVLCYGSVIEINGVRNDRLTDQADTVISSLLSDMKLSAKRYDGKCDRLLNFTFEVILAEAPTAYYDELKLVSYTTTDRKSTAPLAEVTVWQEGMFGGEVRIFTPQEYTDKMDEHLKALLDRFETDFFASQFALE